MSKSAIEWTDVAHTVVRGCSPASAGCLHCYAARLMGTRQKHLWVNAGTARRGDFVDVKLGKGRGKNFVFNGRVELDRDALAKALRKGALPPGSRCFWNHLSDTFHESLTDEQIAVQIGIMAVRSDVTFIVLTKRAARMQRFFQEHAPGDIAGAISDAILRGKLPCPPGWQEQRQTHYHSTTGAWLGTDVWYEPCEWPMVWPLPNLWLGVSVEDQATADERIPLLLQCPAAITWVSYEPALGPVDLGLQSATCDCCQRWPSRWVRLCKPVRGDFPSFAVANPGIYRAHSNQHGALSVQTDHGLLGIKPNEFQALPSLGWVVAGAESGPGARPASLEWFRAARDQCRGAGVPFFLKQADVCISCGGTGDGTAYIQAEEGHIDRVCGACNGAGDHGSVRKGNPSLDGQVWTQMPQMGGEHV